MFSAAVLFSCKNAGLFCMESIVSAQFLIVFVDMAFRYNSTQKEPEISQAAKLLLASLSKIKTHALIPTDKTNTFRLMDLHSYCSQMKVHLLSNGKPALRSTLVKVQKDALAFISSKEGILSPAELAYATSVIKSCRVPTPKLLVKDHKKQDPHGNYPTRLVIPASNFVAAIPHLGYKGIKNLLEEFKIPYMSKIIIQASDLKETLEEMNLHKSTCTLASIDAENYYPSVRFKLIRKAVTYFAASLPVEKQNTIKHCLEIIQFGMRYTFLNFQGEYYEYDPSEDPEEKGLSIGAYESAWLADLVIAYVLEKTQACLQTQDMLKFYRDDGWAVFNRKLSYPQMIAWMNEFQDTVNTIAEGDYLRFTCNMWIPQEEPHEDYNPYVKVTTQNLFPYLDLQMSWINNGLSFKVYKKPNQQLHYLNNQSLHTRACKRAIPEGVYNRLGKLTTMTPSNRSSLISEVYPEHYQKLQVAGLIKGQPPTMEEVHKWAQSKKTPAHKQKKASEQQERNKKVFFIINQSPALTKPIHKIINKAKQELDLKWLKVSMAYSKFSNLRELFQRDLTAKLNEEVQSLDYMTRECNCKPGSQEPCPYDNICRERIIVYQMQHRHTGHCYIGSTSCTAKSRFQQHNSQTVRCHETGQRSTSVAKFFAATLMNWRPGTVSARLVRNQTKYSILWQGNPLSTVQTFGTPSCKLCSKERLEIYKRARFKRATLINERTNLFEACNHKPSFHRYKVDECTDETQQSRKGPAESNHRVLVSV